MDIEELAGVIGKCRRCGLSEARTKAVPGTGDPSARVMLVGEAPGRDEDIAGRPFVGRAGRVLEGVLERCGTDRDAVFITNAVKCRPPNNRVPRAAEVSACKGYLLEQIRIVRPVVVAPMGNVATGTLMKLFGIRGNPPEFRCRRMEMTLDDLSFSMFPVYHPAACLHNPTIRDRVEGSFRMLFDLCPV